MRYRELIKASAAGIGKHRWLLTGALLLSSLLLMFGLPAWWRKPVVETITTREGSQTHAAPGPAVNFTP
ncbi:MAG TPA: hypothetical protein VM095_08450, partial [Pyrinomonadaceae bacterium]|nr:hypothetical protein [Pyrinomonadaceae bacterium]